MSYKLLAQIAGGIFGFGIGYLMYYVVDRKEQLQEAEREARHQAEMAALKTKL